MVAPEGKSQSILAERAADFKAEVPNASLTGVAHFVEALGSKRAGAICAAAVKLQ